MTTSATTDMSSLIDRPVRYDLAESTSAPLRVADLADVADLGGVRLGYGTSRGAADLRELIAADAGVDAGDVLVTVGAIEAMSLVAHVACAPGDRVLVVTPGFPPARTVPAALGAVVDEVRTTFDDGYRLPLDRIAGALTARTRLVSLASPQNPSGVRLTPAELTALLATVAERAPDAVVLIDETYRDATYGGDPVPPSAAALSPRVVTCSSLSKAHGTPGLRLGWLTATDPELYERLRAAKFRTTIAGSTLDELLGTRVLRRREILAPRADRLRHALDEVLRWIRDEPLEIVVPDGGALCCVRLPAGRFTDEAVTAFYAGLAERDTRVAPGSWFGDSDRVFRLGFGHLPPADLTAALSLVAEAADGITTGPS